MIPLVLAVLMQTAGVPPQTTPPVLRTIERGQTSWVDSPRQAVARTPQDWAALWGLHAPDRPLPAVDFSTDMVIAIFLGSRPSADFRWKSPASRKRTARSSSSTAKRSRAAMP